MNEPSEVKYGMDDDSRLCDGLLHFLYRLDIGHNRTVKHWMGVELCMLLTEGKDALEEYRNREINWWG